MKHRLQRNVTKCGCFSAWEKCHHGKSQPIYSQTILKKDQLPTWKTPTPCLPNPNYIKRDLGKESGALAWHGDALGIGLRRTPDLRNSAGRTRMPIFGSPGRSRPARPPARPRPGLSECRTPGSGGAKGRRAPRAPRAGFLKSA